MQINRNTFSGIIVPLITPFYNNAVDFDSLKKLCDYYVKQGADAFVVGGTTGEPATLTVEEKKLILDFVVKNYSEKLPILAGISSSSTEIALHDAIKLQSAGADGLLVLSPPYIKPSQQGIYEHYKHISESVLIPTIIYNIPHRTGVNIEFDTIKKLSTLKNIMGIKESAGDVNQLMNIILGTSLRVFTGEDHLLLITCMFGGHGAISAASHVVLPEMKKVFNDVASGNLNDARETFKKMISLIRLCFAEPNPAPIKAILKHLGFIQSEELRLPLMRATDVIVAKYSELVKN